MLEKLALYFSYPFVRYALIVGVLIALCASLLGVTLVLKRLSFIGDGLSHVAFGAIAVATVAKVAAPMTVVLPITVVCAVLFLYQKKIRGDAAIAMVSVGSLAVGYLIMNMFSTSTNLSGDVCSTLFGSVSILTLTKTEVWMCIVLSVAVVTIFVLFYHRIFAVTFDEDFAKASGSNARAYNLLLAVVISVIIVLSMNLVGTLLISALVVFPAVCSMSVFRSFLSVTVCSSILAVACAAAGILISILSGTPIGATIVAVNIAAFFVCQLVGLFARR